MSFQIEEVYNCIRLPGCEVRASSSSFKLLLTSVCDVLAWKVSVQIHEESIIGAGKEVSLIQEIALRIQRRQPDYSSIEVTGSNGPVQLSENALDYCHRVQLVPMDRS